MNLIKHLIPLLFIVCFTLVAGIYLGILSNRWSFNDFIWLYVFNFHEDIPDNYYESKDFAI